MQRGVVDGRCQLRRPRPRLVVRSELSTGRDRHRLERVERALRGKGELAQRGDLVTPQLGADGTFTGGRKDVDDPAPDGELAAALDYVVALVAHRDQPSGELVEVERDSFTYLDRLQRAPRRRHQLRDAL